ncbi:MAG TPA: hypothetical protein VF189_00555 [Patescibacteria group bacterium]
MEFYSSLRSQKGQALLIVVLIIVVTLTVGLSLASRSLIQLRNSVDEANSQAAFSAAEAGVEQALKLGNVNGTGVISGISLNDKNSSQISNVDVTIIQSSQILLNNGIPLFQDNGADVWLSPYDSDPTKLFNSQTFTGTLSIYWGTSTDPCSDPAIEVLVISGTKTSPTLSKYAYDQCGSGSSQPNKRSNGFPNAPQAGTFTVSGVNGDQTFNYKAQIAVTNGLIARIVPLYHPGSIGIEGLNLPAQGKIITSTGTAGVTNSKVVRKVTFFQGYPQLPIQLYYSLFTSK